MLFAFFVYKMLKNPDHWIYRDLGVTINLLVIWSLTRDVKMGMGVWCYCDGLCVCCYGDSLVLHVWLLYWRGEGSCAYVTITFDSPSTPVPSTISCRTLLVTFVMVSMVCNIEQLYTMLTWCVVISAWQYCILRTVANVVYQCKCIFTTREIRLPYIPVVASTVAFCYALYVALEVTGIYVSYVVCYCQAAAFNKFLIVYAACKHTATAMYTENHQLDTVQYNAFAQN